MDSSAALEDAILRLLEERGVDKTICPSEAARAVGGDDWRDSMPAVREAAQRLVVRGSIVVTQEGQIVDGNTARGPVRLRLR
jgi:hypothetical protein